MGTRKESKKRHAKLTSHISNTDQMNRSNMGPRSKAHMLEPRLANERAKRPQYQRNVAEQAKITTLKKAIRKVGGDTTVDHSKPHKRYKTK